MKRKKKIAVVVCYPMNGWADVMAKLPPKKRRRAKRT